MTILITGIILLGGIGTISAVLLYGTSKKFEVYEDPLIGQVLEVLPSANCGGCGYPGCSGFASACVKADTLEGLNCPVGGAEVLDKVANILGKAAEKSEPRIAVVRCNGNCEARKKTNEYGGVRNCAIASNLYDGETGCSYGCFGYGDCVAACTFGAIRIDESTGLPLVDEEKCTSCGACVKSCPKGLIELRKKGPKSRRIYVQCMNKDKGGQAKKACDNACIGCSKCSKECAFEAISITNNLAFIDSQKCRLCRKCVSVCPTNAIVELNFPPRKEQAEAKDAEKILN